MDSFKYTIIILLSFLIGGLITSQLMIKDYCLESCVKSIKKREIITSNTKTNWIEIVWKNDKREYLNFH